MEVGCVRRRRRKTQGFRECLALYDSEEERLPFKANSGSDSAYESENQPTATPDKITATHGGLKELGNQI